MRIERVRFKNLNSLNGEWEIDLQNKVYRADGIFAITGPTGAGKSTVLDAICLALYGRTPRLRTISKSSNEIMSRRTGECHAEVCFSIGTRHFRCRWNQRRARKQANGELQQPQHEFADLDTGSMETNIRAVAEQVETVTGMNFDRFTRSMLLAQGKFAAFLQSQPDERAPILEQITGTEVYSRISVKVHERRNEEQKSLELLLADMAGLQLLSSEEEQELANLLQESTQRDAVLKLQVEQKNELIAWLNRLASLRSEVRDIHEQQKTLHLQVQAFAPLAEKQRLAELALELAGHHATLMQIRQQLRDEQGRKERCAKNLVSCKITLQQSQKALNNAEQQWNIAKATQEQTLPLLHHARVLDLKIQEKTLPILAAEKTLTGQQQALIGLSNKQAQDKQYLGRKQEQLTTLQGQIAKNQHDASLPEQVAVLSAEIKALNKLITEQQNKHQALTQQEKLLPQVEQSWQALDKKLQKLQDQSNTQQRELAAKEQAYQKNLTDKAFSVWQDDRLRLVRIKDRLQHLQNMVRELQELQKTARHMGQSQVALQTEKQSLANQLTAANREQKILEQEAGKLEEKLLLLQKIADLETARCQLQDGRPCPLCGALEHPFSAASLPKPDVEQERLTSIRVECKKWGQKISQMEVNQAKIATELVHAATTQETATRQVEEKTGRFLQDCAAFSLTLDPAASDLDQRLAQLIKETQKKLATTEQVIAVAEQMEKEKTQIRAHLEASKEHLATASQEIQKAFLAKQGSAEALARLQDEYRTLNAEQGQALAGLREKVSLYRLAISLPVMPKQLAELDALLQQRRNQWLAWQRQKETLSQEIEKAKLQLQHQQALIAKESESIQQRQQELALLQHERARLAQERTQCFGTENPDQKEQELRQIVARTEQLSQQARLSVESAGKEESQQSAILADLKRSIGQKTEQVHHAAGDFIRRCQSLGFQREMDYQKACLSEEERKSLAEQAHCLEREQMALQIRAVNPEQHLQEEQRRSLSEIPLETLQEEREALLAEQQENQQQSGALRQQLEANTQQKDRQKEQLQAVHRQKQVCERWNMLHSLIGSADGKKFRNFAQGLTFERMIALANQQLQKMNDRYLLIRDSRQPLELNVVDNYQAGEIRSAKNLSGGESFIVSLALALGLSRMVGSKVRMDSLFLDEGFGTLDDEALDIALGTLSSLRLEGKLIGIISHVSALQDRIAARILVTPGKGGKSALVGPGCSRIDSETKATQTVARK